MGDSDSNRPFVHRLHKLLDSGMGRRRFLRTAANAGYAVGMARLLDVDEFIRAAGDEVPIVYGFARADPEDPQSLRPRQKLVPAEWYNELEHAFNLKNRLADAGIGELLGAFVVPGNSANPASSISVEVSGNDTERIRERISGILDTVDFDINVLDEFTPPDDEEDGSVTDVRYAENLDNKRVPGGVGCEAADSIGSLAPAMYNVNGTSFFTTANHLFGDQGGKATDHRGESLYLSRDAGRVKIGEVVRGYPTEDFVMVRPVDGYEPASAIYEAFPATVVGEFSKYGLADLQSRGRPLEKWGALSDYTLGEIKGIDGVTCYTGICRNGQLKWGGEGTVIDGDSGSVNFHPDPARPDEYVMVGGFNNARTWWPGESFAWGTAAYHIRDTYRFSF